MCIAQHDIEQPQDLGKTQTGCLLQNWQDHQGQVSWKVACPGQPRSSSTGKMTIRGDTFEGTATVITELEGFQLPISTHYIGRRLGKCVQQN